MSSTEELQSFLKRYGNDTNVFNRQSGLGTRVHQMKKENTPSKPLRFVNQGHVEPSHDGQPGELDIYEMKLAWPGQGHLIINRWLTARKTPKKLFDSKIRLSVPNGGIQPATGDFATVPETGYLKFVEFSSPTNHWAIRVETNYFVKLGNGNYSRIFITFQTDQPSIDIRSYNDITGSKDFKWTVEQPAKQVFE